ncbi:hypothetical protein T484DRAFT_1834018, partial [Baffinella frigidus]
MLGLICVLRASADPALLLLRPPLGSARVCPERAASPWGHRSAVAGDERQERYLSIPGQEGATGEVGDDSFERPARWGALGLMRGGGGGGGWHGPRGDDYDDHNKGVRGGTIKGKRPCNGVRVGAGRGGGA